MVGYLLAVLYCEQKVPEIHFWSLEYSNINPHFSGYWSGAFRESNSFLVII